MSNNIFGSLEYFFYGLLGDVMSYAPEILIAVVLVVAGWIVGGALMRITERIFIKLKIDQALDAAGLMISLKRRGITSMPVSSSVRW